MKKICIKNEISFNRLVFCWQEKFCYLICYNLNFYVFKNISNEFFSREIIYAYFKIYIILVNNLKKTL